MKTIIIIAISLLLAGCAVPSNPKMSFGKKCHVVDGYITYSYVWVYDKTLAKKPTAEQCEQIKN